MNKQPPAIIMSEVRALNECIDKIKDYFNETYSIELNENDINELSNFVGQTIIDVTKES